MTQTEGYAASNAPASDRPPETVQAEATRALALIEIEVARLEAPQQKTEPAPIGTSAKPLPRV
jgi:hypothetical protein